MGTNTWPCRPFHTAMTLFRGLLFTLTFKEAGGIIAQKKDHKHMEKCINAGSVLRLIGLPKKISN